MSKNIYIENCDYTFEYKCPLEWSNLKKTKDSKVRFCGECDKIAKVGRGNEYKM